MRRSRGVSCAELLTDGTPSCVDRVDLIHMVTFQWARLAGWRVKKRLKLPGFVVGRFPPIKWVDPARSPAPGACGVKSGGR